MLKKTAFMMAMLGTLAVPGAELVKNGDFENGLKSWFSAQRSGGRKDVHTCVNQTEFGKQCLKAVGDPENKYNSFLSLTQQLPVLDSNTTYILRAKVCPNVKEPADKEFKVVIRQENADGKGLGYTGFTVNLEENKWLILEMPFKPRKDAVKFAFYIISTKLAGEDAILLDDVSLVPEKDLM